jgi:diguanylate cyclase (GGDEF)-like protein
MKILIADDNASFCSLLGQTLSGWGYEVVFATDGQQAWNLLRTEDAPRLAILDWMMPGLDGLEICRALRGQVDRAYTYVILLTSRSGKEDLLGGLDAGADEYLVKPIDPHELRMRLRAGQRILELQAHLLAAQETILHQATHDPLTGLWNRAVVLDALNRELARSWREGKPVGVMLADVDHFKRINDTYGHLGGDAVLREVSRAMTQALRHYDSLGRYGGEEFLVVLPDCDAANTWKLGERLRQCVSDLVLNLRDGRVRVTISVGMATSCGADRLEAETMLRLADDALYRAKEAGRNRVELGEVPAPSSLSGHVEGAG